MNSSTQSSRFLNGTEHAVLNVQRGRQRGTLPAGREELGPADFLVEPGGEAGKEI